MFIGIGMFIRKVRVDSCSTSPRNLIKNDGTAQDRLKMAFTNITSHVTKLNKNTHNNVSFLESFRLGGFSVLSLTWNAQLCKLVFQ